MRSRSGSRYIVPEIAIEDCPLKQTSSMNKYLYVKLVYVDVAAVANFLWIRLSSREAITNAFNLHICYGWKDQDIIAQVVA